MFIKSRNCQKHGFGMARLQQIRKRDGSLEQFQAQKIHQAIQKAFISVKGKNAKKARKLSDQVVAQLEKHFSAKITPSIEDVQDVIEEILIKNKYADVAKAYILYRQKHKEVREFKTFLGVRDELKLDPNAIKVLAKRYLMRNEQGNIVETTARLFRRVARAVAMVDRQYDPRSNFKKIEEAYFNVMAKREFLPNSPTLMNAGTSLGQLSACFVIPVGDSLSGIFDAVKQMAIIHQSGGGTGFSFSKLRPRGDLVRSTKGVASGPVSYMRIFDMTTEVIKQGGKRRGANMGILRCDHPDILEFINAKTHEGWLTNFNTSVAVTEKFMHAVDQNLEYDLVNPRTNKPVKKLKANEVFELIVANAWRTADPGLIFIDEINKKNPTASTGLIESTNPCGEVPLHPYEACNLGSINVARFVRNGKPEWERLSKTIKLSIRFLDNVIDANKYPLPEIENMAHANRRIGLGIMGFAEMLIRLKIPYNSKKALDFAERLMKFINDESRKASNSLSADRGNFPNFEKSIWAKDKKTSKGTRNATVTTIAPTGTISIIAGATSGIEPLFAVSFVREVMEGTHLLEVNPVFEEIAKKKGFYSKALMMKIAKKGTVQGLKEVPKDVQRLFVTALEITPDWHVKIQAAFQKHCDNAVSKTINLKENATVEDVRKAYLLAYKLKCKGITIYRYGSKKKQVLYIGKPEEPIAAKSDFAGGCPGIECVH